MSLLSKLVFFPFPHVKDKGISSDTCMYVCDVSTVSPLITIKLNNDVNTTLKVSTVYQRQLFFSCSATYPNVQPQEQHTTVGLEMQQVWSCVTHTKPKGFIPTTAAAVSHLLMSAAPGVLNRCRNGCNNIWSFRLIYEAAQEGGCPRFWKPDWCSQQIWRVWQHIIGFDESLLPEKHGLVLLKWLTGKRGIY